MIIIDIGGEFICPGVGYVVVVEEIVCIVFVIVVVMVKLDVLISIDICKVFVVCEVLLVGVMLINDVLGFIWDGDFVFFVVEVGVFVCVMYV